MELVVATPARLTPARPRRERLSPPDGATPTPHEPPCGAAAAGVRTNIQRWRLPHPTARWRQCWLPSSSAAPSLIKASTMAGVWRSSGLKLAKGSWWKAYTLFRMMRWSICDPSEPPGTVRKKRTRRLPRIAYTRLRRVRSPLGSVFRSLMLIPLFGNRVHRPSLSKQSSLRI